MGNICPTLPPTSKFEKGGGGGGRKKDKSVSCLGMCCETGPTSSMSFPANSQAVSDRPYKKMASFFFFFLFFFKLSYLHLVLEKEWRKQKSTLFCPTGIKQKFTFQHCFVLYFVLWHCVEEATFCRTSGCGVCGECCTVPSLRKFSGRHQLQKDATVYSFFCPV